MENKQNDEINKQNDELPKEYMEILKDYNEQMENLFERMKNDRKKDKDEIKSENLDIQLNCKEEIEKIYECLYKDKQDFVNFVKLYDEEMEFLHEKLRDSYKKYNINIYDIIFIVCGTVVINTGLSILYNLIKGVL